MKVLMLIESLTCGGKERRLVELLRGLKKFSPIQCELALMSKNIFYSEIFDLGIKIHYTERKIKKDPRIFYWLYKICKDFKPDIIHTWSGMASVYAAPVAKMLKIKLINGMITHATPKKKLSRGYIYGRLSFPFSDVVLANSFAGLRALKIPEGKKCCIQNGFDFDRAESLRDADSIKKDFGIATSKVVGMIGALNQRRKDYGTLISAAEILLSEDPDTTFLFVGGGEGLDRFRMRIKAAHKDNIKFLGMQKDVESIINAFDVAVLCTYFEGFSNVIMEYMALGKPVVATNTGGNPELVIDGKTGYLVPKEDSEAVANKVRYLLNNPEVAESMGEAGQKRIKDFFSLDLMVEKYDRLYTIVCGEKKKNLPNRLKDFLQMTGESRQNKA